LRKRNDRYKLEVDDLQRENAQWKKGALSFYELSNKAEPTLSHAGIALSSTTSSQSSFATQPISPSVSHAAAPSDSSSASNTTLGTITADMWTIAISLTSNLITRLNEAIQDKVMLHQDKDILRQEKADLKESLDQMEARYKWKRQDLDNVRLELGEANKWRGLKREDEQKSAQVLLAAQSMVESLQEQLAAAKNDRDALSAELAKRNHYPNSQESVPTSRSLETRGEFAECRITVPLS